MLKHAMNAVIMVLDVLIVAYPIRLLHVVQPVTVGLCYVIFSVIYYAAGGVDDVGNHYIYNVLDWSKPGTTVGVVAGVLLLAVVAHLAMFLLHKLRALVYSSCCIRPTILPTTANGYNNEAFASSTEKF